MSFIKSPTARRIDPQGMIKSALDQQRFILSRSFNNQTKDGFKCNTPQSDEDIFDMLKTAGGSE